ncbi:polymorphic toxin type 34 domain-containing protein [Haliangium sp.]|uniref:polymorphic toxin type 34 domain-containing protein n=1 Tax=Haliangium sp. TaxID=2663208 RepID=UPI003D1305FF
MEDTIALTAAGRVKDTGIMEEIWALLAEMGLESSPENQCRALRILWNRADDANDNKKKSRIVTTEKAMRCRGSRHKRE